MILCFERGSRALKIERLELKLKVVLAVFLCSIRNSQKKQSNLNHLAGQRPFKTSCSFSEDIGLGSDVDDSMLPSVINSRMTVGRIWQP